MADILSPTGIEKPVGGEQHSRAMVNRNYDRTNQIAIDKEKFAKGAKAHADNGSPSVGLGGTAVMCDLVAMTFEANRMYEIRYRVTTTTNMADMAITAVIKKSALAVTDNTGTDLGFPWTIYTAPVANQGKTDEIYIIFKATVAETVNIKAVMARATGAVTYDIDDRSLTVKDLGAWL